MKFLKRMSNLHPNGFWIYMIKIFWNGARLRIHFWPKNVERLDTPHNHRSWFISIPLWGRFSEKRFVETSGNNFEVLKCHRTASGGNGSLTTPIGTGSIRLVSQHRRWPLIPYLCRLGTIHSLVPKSNGTAFTIVLFGPHKEAPKAWIPLCGQPNVDGDPCRNPAEELGKPCNYCRVFDEMCKRNDEAMDRGEFPGRPL
jgi:hypothetical protein